MDARAIVVRHWSAKTLNNNQSQGPDIHLLCDVALRIVALGCHVACRAAIAVLERDVQLQLSVEILVQKHTCRLQVPMSERRRKAVKIGHSLGDLKGHRSLLV